MSGNTRQQQVMTWLRKEDAGMMDEYITTTGMWIFSTTVVVIFAGLLWGALSGDFNSLVTVLQNLF